MFVTTAIVGAQNGVGSFGPDPTTDDDGRIQTAGCQRRGDQGRRRRLAVGAGHRDTVFQSHQLGQHLGSADHRYAFFAGRGDFAIGFGDRR
jgi:hypothetical protein